MVYSFQDLLPVSYTHLDVYKRQIVDGIEGRGQFVGVTLATGMNGNNSCWVEGEARMYLDDDPYP